MSGKCVESIVGQPNIGYSISDFTDFYDMVELSKQGGYAGSTITFYDWNTGRVYKPFPKEKNVLYGKPIFSKGYLWFLQGDFAKGIYTLFRYLLDTEPEQIIQLDIKDVDPYNLRLIGEEIHITSEDDHIICYYPEKFKFHKESHEGLIMITGNKVYLSEWVEEGWDDKNDCATDEYNYYEKIIVRDFAGTKLSEEVGSLEQRPDGTWWIS